MAMVGPSSDSRNTVTRPWEAFGRLQSPMSCLWESTSWLQVRKMRQGPFSPSDHVTIKFDLLAVYTRSQDKHAKESIETRTFLVYNFLSKRFDTGTRLGSREMTDIEQSRPHRKLSILLGYCFPIACTNFSASPATMQVPLDPAAQTQLPKSTFMDLNFNSVLESPVFAGGLGLAALGSAAAIARRGAIRSAQVLRRQLLVNVEISKTDPSYPWILGYLSRPREPVGFLASRLTRIRQLSVKTTTRSAAPGKSGNNVGPMHAHFALVPGYGSHVIRHAPGVYIMVQREKSSTAEMSTGEPHETMTLTALWAHRHVFEEIFGDAHSMMARATEGKTVVYTVRGFDWVQLGEPRRKRPLGSVVLDEGVKEGIVADVKDFIDRQEWYAERGIPYRRGYLLFGPPGSGKSSFIHALAGELNFAIATINLSERGMADDKLAMMMQKLPARTIVLLEDADAAFVNRKQKESDGYSGSSVTFSGLLNALDGLSAGEERIAFLTTNHIDRLDPALIRPGRVDMIVRIGEASRYQAAQMFDRFYGDVDQDGNGRERFLHKLDSMGLFDEQNPKQTSAAAIQGIFLFNKNDMEGAIVMAEVLGQPQPTDS